MLKLKNLDKEVYSNYVKSKKEQSHFLHSECFGEFVKVKEHLTPYYLGLVDENDKILAVTLIFLEHTKMNRCFLYIPAGFIIDYNDKNLVKSMTKGVLSFAKNKKAISIKMTPYISDTVSKKDKDNIMRTLKEVGFKYTNEKKKRIMLPNVVSRIDLTKDLEEIENNFSEETKDHLLQSIKLETETVIGNKSDVKELYNLMLEDNKKPIYDEDYYETLYEIFNGNKDTKATIILGKVNLNKIIKNIEKNIKRINDQISILPIDNLTKSSKTKLKGLTKQKEDLALELEKFRTYKQKYNYQLTLSAHLIIEFADKAWLLYDYNSDRLKETSIKYNTYYKDIKYCKNNNLKYIEQKEPSTLRCDFKAKTEQNIGQWKYITNPIFYFIITKILLKKDKKK